MRVLDIQGLTDIGFHGYCCMWSNKREGDEHIKEHLDWFLCTQKWMDMWLSSQVHNIIWEGSDLFPILMDTEPHTCKKKEKYNSIKFEAYYKKEDEFSEVVTTAWNETKGFHVAFLDRFQACGKIFRNWGYDKFGALPE